MNFGPRIDPPEVLVHYNLTQVHSHSIRHLFLFGVIRTASRHTGVLPCVVLKRRLEFGTTEEMLPSYLDEQYVEGALRSDCQTGDAEPPTTRCRTLSCGLVG